MGTANHSEILSLFAKVVKKKLDEICIPQNISLIKCEKCDALINIHSNGLPICLSVTAESVDADESILHVNYLIKELL